MSFKQTLNALLIPEAAEKLQPGTKNVTVKWLRQGLYEMGFGKALGWIAESPDGDYDEALTAALHSFAKRNQLETDGKTIFPALLKKLQERYDLLQSLEALHRAILLTDTETFYDPNDTTTVGTLAVDRCLRELGFVQPIVNEALAEFAKLENLPFDGKVLNSKLAIGLRGCLLYFYGEGFLELPWFESLKNGIFIKDTGKEIQVSAAGSEMNVVFKKYKSGIYTVGSQTIKKFLETERDAVRALNVSDAAIDMMMAVSVNEGNLDAINTYDNSYISFGAFQWTLGSSTNAGELAALLKKIKIQAPQAFQEFFGQYGIDVDASTGTTYGFLQFRGNKVVSTADKDLFRPAHRAYRFWLAGQDKHVKAVEVEHALSRLMNFYWKPELGTKRYSLAQIITSQYGVALILDNHVNRPAYVVPCVQHAMQESGLTGDPLLWDSKDEQRLIDAYLRIREVYGSSPMTDARTRSTRTKRYLDQGIISAERNSFRYSATGERSLDLVPMPPNHYDPEAYPVIRRNGMVM